MHERISCNVSTSYKIHCSCDTERFPDLCVISDHPDKSLDEQGFIEIMIEPFGQHPRRLHLLHLIDADKSGYETRSHNLSFC